jgi:hypothetical protein
MVRSSRCQVAEGKANPVEQEWLAFDILAAVTALESSMVEPRSDVAFAGDIEPASMPMKDAVGSRLVNREQPALGLAYRGVVGMGERVVAGRNVRADGCQSVDPGYSRRTAIVRGTVGGLRMLLPL